MAKKSGKLTGAALRAFRHEVSILKKKGLVSKRTDARKQKPSRYMIEKVARLKPVIEGKQTSVKLDRTTAARYKANGFFVFGNRVVVSKGQTEAVRRDAKSGLIVLSEIGRDLPFEKVILPYSITTLDQFLIAARKSPPDPQIWAAKKRPQDYWAFTYHGNNSLETFPDLGALAEHLFKLYNHYVDLRNQPDNPKVFEHFVLYRTSRRFWEGDMLAKRENRRRASRQKFNRDRAEQRRVDNKKLLLRGREIAQAKQETYEEQNRRHQREWYERRKQKLQASPDALEQQRLKWAENKKAQRATKKGK